MVVGDLALTAFQVALVSNLQRLVTNSLGLHPPPIVSL